MSETPQPSSARSIFRARRGIPLVFIVVVLGYCTFALHRASQKAELPHDLATSTSLYQSDSLVSVTAVKEAVTQVVPRGAAATADLKGCLRAFLSVEIALTHQDLNICKFNADSDYPRKNTFETRYPLKLSALRAAEKKVLGFSAPGL